MIGGTYVLGVDPHFGPGGAPEQLLLTVSEAALDQRGGHRPKRVRLDAQPLPDRHDVREQPHQRLREHRPDHTSTVLHQSICQAVNFNPASHELYLLLT